MSLEVHIDWQGETHFVGRLRAADHGGNNLQSAHSKTAQPARLTLNIFPVGPAVNARQVTIMPAQIHPQVIRGAQ